MQTEGWYQVFLTRRQQDLASAKFEVYIHYAFPVFEHVSNDSNTRKANATYLDQEDSKWAVLCHLEHPV